ncbi:SDR family oxidoreductase [Streptomyces olivoverticillatus]
MERTANQVTVVTGGGRGIGAAVALRLARAGHSVGIGYEQSREAAEKTAAAVRAEGVPCVAVQADTSVESEVDALFDAVREQLGPVTGLVNNAGITGLLGRFTETPVERMRRVVDVNVMGALICARRAALEMSTRHGGSGGAIVNISSCAATLGSPGEYVHYAASKAAVDAMTMGLSKELAEEGIRVNSVQPGMIVTGLHAAMGDEQRPWRKARLHTDGPPRGAGRGVRGGGLAAVAGGVVHHGCGAAGLRGGL